MPEDDVARSGRRSPLPRAALLAYFAPLAFGLGVDGDPAPPLRLGADLGLVAPPPLPTGDEDGDGLADEEEQALAERFAPIVLLDAEDANRPASIPWLLERVAFRHEPGTRTHGARVAPAPSPPPFELPDSARAGGGRAEDWTVYVHVYPRADGGINVQYWFYYPYNDGPLFFDHDSDWEHVTVRLDRARVPLGAYLARHEDDHPGPFWDWARLRKEGEHPIVLSARGTHATYADRSDAPWFEHTSACERVDACAGPVWRTWEGGGLAHVGERARPLGPRDELTFPGRWGKTHVVPGTSAPFGPLHHRGFCSDGYASCSAVDPGEEARADDGLATPDSSGSDNSTAEPATIHTAP